MTANIDHMEFWAQLDQRIRAERQSIQQHLDAAGGNLPHEGIRHYLGQRYALAAVRTMAREIFAEMTGTAPAGPDPEPEDDFPV